MMISLTNPLMSLLAYAGQLPFGQIMLGFGDGAAQHAGAGADGGGDASTMTQSDILHEMAKSIEPANWAESFLFIVVDVGIVTLTIGMLIMFYRIVRGPQLADRVLASDTFSLHVVGLVILLAIRLRTEVYFDAALVVAIIGFASTLAFAQYIGNRRRRKESAAL